ncbi:hypothetical protein LAUMK13_01599 [Mycobacterium innocens]|uniref:Uncharacterized protein n=1 Tax=Mycobacterium innocens TaxID=2341083 RepID=A0A498PXC0_9MYCO|nr:hypothetical protein LAUMK13_01599 [Mycobacterium innocens]
MCVGPAEAERRHRGAARSGCRGPRGGIGRHEQPGRRRVDGGVPPGEVQIARNLSALDRQHRLDESGHPGGGLQVTDVGLDRAQRARALALAFTNAIRGRQRLELDGIAQYCSGAVCFDILDAVGGDVGEPQRRGDHVALSQRVGCGHAVGAAVLVGCRTSDHRQYPVPVAQRVGQPFEHHHTAALAAHESVGVGVEAVAATGRRQRRPLGQRDRGERGQRELHPAGECDVGFAQPQALTGQVDRHQRRRARGVHGDGRTAQSQQVGDPAHRSAMRGSGAQVGVDVGSAFDVDDRVVPRRQPHHHAGSAAAQGIRLDTGVFERFPGNLEQHSMLWVHRHGFAGRDAEEVGVESVDVGNETAPFRRHSPGRRRVGVVERVRIPAIRRHLADGVHTVDQQLPKAFRSSHIPGETATDTHHRDRLGDVGGEDRPGAHELARQGGPGVRRQLRRALCQARHDSPRAAASSSLASTRSASKSISSSDSSGSASAVCCAAAGGA